VNIFAVAIPAILIGSYLFDFLVEYLNIKNLKPNIPEEMQDVYDKKEYKKSQAYLKESTIFGLIRSGMTIALILAAIYSGFLNTLDQFARSIGTNEITSGVVFLTLGIVISQLIALPFSAYATFVIEEKYGFNKATPKLFISDQLKSLVLTLLIGLPVFALLVFFFQQFGRGAWLIGWVSISAIQLLLTFLAPTIIMPLFNKFTPLEEGKLRKEIERFAKKQNFKLEGIYKMDGSKRSTKSNAFFTGFGKYKRIALFDTLIEKHTVPELVSVLAHEIGHYKKNHIWKLYSISVASTGLMLYLLSRLINSQELFNALNVEQESIYMSLIMAGLLFGPLGSIIGIIANYFSRQFEYEADAYAVTKYKHPKAFIDALKKLSVSNLTNLTPHPLKVVVDYSHPPILNRVKAIKIK
jgi:STE24 endopeptidase